MISLGSDDARKGLGLGFGGRKMEEAELEKGDACSYNNNNDDYDASTDPEADLSSLAYIGQSLVVTDHSYQLMHVLLVDLIQRVHQVRAAMHPDLQKIWLWSSQSWKAGPPPINFGTLPTLKASSANDSIEQEVSITPADADELADVRESANKKAAIMLDQKILKV